jgi:hypothetical protein
VTKGVRWRVLVLPVGLVEYLGSSPAISLPSTQPPSPRTGNDCCRPRSPIGSWPRWTSRPSCGGTSRASTSASTVRSRGPGLPQELPSSLREKGPVRAPILGPGALAGEAGLSARASGVGVVAAHHGIEGDSYQPAGLSGLKSSVLGLGPFGMGAASLKARGFSGR